jgi:hypothetical protein
MTWELVVILVVAIPIILFPAAYVWYINIGGLALLFKESREKQAIRKKIKQELEYERALTETVKKYPW